MAKNKITTIEGLAEMIQRTMASRVRTARELECPQIYSTDLDDLTCKI
jgi:hypothetical protein